MEEENNVIQDNIVLVETTETNEELEILKEIHNDLGIITCFIVFFTLVIILKYAYKFFNMIFSF